jgi:toxin ParE1/3/4
LTVKPVIPRRQAEGDVEDAIEHYLAEAGEEVTLRFIDALQAVYLSIARHPASGSPRYAHELDLPGLRFGQLIGYPYLVFYMEREDHVDVWRVLHEERDIPAWMRGPYP